jgi:uncharacterized membrane protein YfcA
VEFAFWPSSPDGLPRRPIRLATPALLTGRGAAALHLAAKTERKPITSRAAAGGITTTSPVSVWGLLCECDIKALNAPRTLVVVAANTVAVVTFIVAGAVVWPQTLAMLIGGLGGIAGARVGRKLPPRLTRWLTLAVSVAITTVFFVRAYLSG